MPEPVTIVTGVIALVKTAFSLTLATFTAVDGIKEAPKHLRAISSDLKAFYSVLGTLKSYLRYEDTASGVLHPTTVADLDAALVNCVDIFKQLQALVNDFIKEGEFAKPNKDKSAKRKKKLSNWNAVRFTWKEKEFANLREHLAEHKITLDVAIAVANFINTCSTKDSIHRIEQDVRELRHNVTQLLQRGGTVENPFGERGIVPNNYNSPLRQFARGADSIMTATSLDRQRPSSTMAGLTSSNVSSRSTYETAQTGQQGYLTRSVSDSSTYESAVSDLSYRSAVSELSYKSAFSNFTYQPLNQQTGDTTAEETADVDRGQVPIVRAAKSSIGTKSKTTIQPKNDVYQIFVKGLTPTTLVISSESCNTVDELKRVLWQKTGTPPDKISLSFNGRHLQENKRLFSSHIPHNSTLLANINHASYSPTTLRKSISTGDGWHKIIPRLNL